MPIPSPGRPAALLFACALALAAALAACGGGDSGSGTDGGPSGDGSLPPDAHPMDGSVVDCSADHRESADHTNDPITLDSGAAEDTGLGLAGGGPAFTICGQIDPAQANSVVVDGDVYQFTVTGNQPVNLRIDLSAPDGASAHQLTLGLYRVDDGTPIALASGPFRNDYALVAGLLLDPGTYWVSVVAFDPAPSVPVGYTVRVAVNDLACPAASSAPDHSEAADGAQSRGNDVVTIHYPSAPALTAATSDQPEATGLVLAPDTVYHLRGTSADVASDSDNYLDRDTFRFATGPQTTELEVRLTWERDATPDVDLDAYLFAAGDPATDYSLGLGTTVDDRDDEVFTLNVDPGQSYWLWTGAFDDSGQGGAGDLPVTYDITLCPRAHQVAN